MELHRNSPASWVNWFGNPVVVERTLMLFPGFPVPFPRGASSWNQEAL